MKTAHKVAQSGQVIGAVLRKVIIVIQLIKLQTSAFIKCVCYAVPLQGDSNF